MLEKIFEVRYDELDPHGHISPVSLLRYFQEAAALDAQSFAFGWENIQQNRLGWVLTHMQVEFLQTNVKRQPVKIRTWHAFSEKILSRREFEFLTEDGATLARGASWWLLMDVDKRRITKSPPELLALNPAEPNFLVQEENFKRTPAVDAVSLPAVLITTRREDLDLNGHVNNTHYAAWALENAPEGKTLQKLLINFKNECRDGETISVNTLQETELLRHHCLLKSDGKEAAHAITYWQ
ncbi:acyl-[acyl-carrier-protein] thioesterase [Candidatus Avelusimicrobium sp.]